MYWCLERRLPGSVFVATRPFSSGTLCFAFMNSTFILKGVLGLNRGGCYGTSSLFSAVDSSTVFCGYVNVRGLVVDGNGI